MTTRATRSYVRTLLVAALVPAVGLVLIAVTAFVVHRIQLARMRALYDELVATTEAWDFPRAPDPPGWPLEPGAAAELYEAALEACPQAASSRSTHQDLNRALRAMEWDTLDAASRADLMAPGAQPLPTTCVEAGVPEGSSDPVAAQLSAYNCQLLMDCGEAVDQFLAGSRREDARSPGWVWSDWDVYAATGIGKNIQTGWFAKFAIIRGYVAEVGGTEGAWMDASLAAIRHAGDMSRGAAYMPGIVSCSTRDYSADSVRIRLERGSLDAGEADRLRQELAYVNRQPLDHGQMLAGDVVIGIGMLGYARDHDPLPPAAVSLLGPDEPGWRDRIQFVLSSAPLHRSWRDVLSVQGKPYPERLATYDLIDDQLGHSTFAVAGYFRAVGAYDAKVALSNTYMELLELGAAATEIRERTGAAPRSLDSLLAVHGDLPSVDRLTGEPYQVLLEGDLCVIRSPAAAAERQADVGFDRLPNFQPGDRLVVEIPAKATAPSAEPDADGLPAEP